MDILREARERFDRCFDAESDNWDEALDDLKFLHGEQWPEDVKNLRKEESRPCLTINRLPQFIAQVANDQRQNRPSVRVLPVDDHADVDTAEIMNGLIRHIEANSAADIAFDTAFFNAVANGFGYFRLVTDYIDENSFDQTIHVRRIRNPFTVYMDPDCQEADGSDARFCFITEEMRREDYEAKYPDFPAIDLDVIPGSSEYHRWFRKDTVRVAEYWCVKETMEEIALLADGSVIRKKDLPAGFPIIRTRKAVSRKIHWYKINGADVLEEREWPGRWIPVFPVWGNELDIGGKRYLSGIIRNAKDPMRMHNYWRTAATELVALAPKAPFIGAAGQFKGYEKKWAEANVRSFPFLEYNPISIDGQAVPPPQRQPFAGVPVGVVNEAMSAADDIKVVTGIYDAALGAKSNETSGRAILARQRESDNATFNFVDNLSRAMRHYGRVLVDLIPKIYDTDRVARIIGDDGEDGAVRLIPGAKAEGFANPNNGIYDISVGRYDVVVTVGPSYTTRRLEAADSMMQFVQAFPAAGGIIGDLVAKSMDWPGADKIAARLRKILPPGIDDDVPPEPDPAAMAEAEKTAAEVEEKRAKTEGVTLDNMKKQLELSAMDGRLEQMVAETVRQVLTQMATPQGVFPPVQYEDQSL